jgi:hypothetical protein
MKPWNGPRSHHFASHKIFSWSRFQRLSCPLAFFYIPGLVHALLQSNTDRMAYIESFSCLSVWQYHQLPLQPLDSVNPVLYPSIDTILIKLCVLLSMPVASATAEMPFSVLRRLKTYVRSTMKNDRLSCLGLMHILTEILKWTCGVRGVAEA